MDSSSIALFAWLLVGLVPLHGAYFLGIRWERERNARIVRAIRENNNKRRSGRQTYRTLQ